VLLLGLCQHAGVDVQGQQFDPVLYDRAAQQEAMGYQWLRWSVEHIGHRLTGSPEGTKAEHAADSLFRVAGLEHVERFPFTAQAWARERVRLTITDPDGVMHVSAVALANTPLEATVEAPLIDAGNGLPADLDRCGGALKGKVVLVNLGLVDALERGAAGILFVNQVEGHILLTGTASIDGNLIAVPAACIATEDGAAVRKAMVEGRTLSANLSMANRSASITANNILAEIPGSTWPEEVILIGGHLDSWDLATGATDNGLGSFSILDLARAMHAMPFKPARTVRFVLFMGEEQGLLGSRALVKHYRESGELKNIRAMINMDMSGHPQGFGVAGPEGWKDAITTYTQAIRTVDTASFAGNVSDEVWLHSDHQPFLLAGVPVLYPLSDLGKHVYGCYHSSCDDIHLVDPQAMVDNVRFVGPLVYALAGAPALPPHFTETELRQRLIDAGLEQPLRIGGDWPW
jgi:carboxypeptidase Q